MNLKKMIPTILIIAGIILIVIGVYLKIHPLRVDTSEIGEDIEILE